MATKKEETKKKIVPRGKYMFVRQDDPASKVNDFGLYVPENTEDEQKATGVVQSVGEQIADIKKGAHIVFGAFAGEKIKMKEGSKEVDYLLLHDDDVIAFIED